MRIMVTGGTGFIGRETALQAVRRGHQVLLLARHAVDDLPEGCRVICLDLRQPDRLAEALTGIDAVIHCAAAMSGDLDHQRAVTVTGTENLLDAMHTAGVRRLVLLGSLAVYDCHALAVDAELDESAPVESRAADRAPYIQAKLEQEALVRKLPMARGLDWTIVRPGLVHGPGRRWFHHLGIQVRPSRWICLAGDGLLPLCHVTTCADAIVLALESRTAHGATLNLVDDALPTRRAYMEAIAERALPRPSILGLPWTLLDRASRAANWVNRHLLGDLLPLPGLVHPSSLAARCKPLRYSNRLAKETLGWIPARGMGQGREADAQTVAVN